MLDPEGRHEVLKAVRALNEQGVTVVAITHLMDEATEGGRVVVMHAGRIALQGSPREVFGQVDELRGLQLDVPQPTELAYLLNRRDPSFPPNLLTVDEVVDAVRQRALARSGAGKVAKP
jgi:ABC-type multidrug transport system ATPase subunit